MVAGKILAALGAAFLLCGEHRHESPQRTADVHCHHRHLSCRHHHHRRNVGLIRVTNYEPNGQPNADGTRYGGWRVATDWQCYPPGSRLRLHLARATVIATAHDRGGAVQGPLHIDAPTRAFCKATGLNRHGTVYCRFEVLYLAPHWRACRYHHLEKESSHGLGRNALTRRRGSSRNY